ncbi:MAG: M15 family metallopeptidase [bacterium]|nr:M15 family metallopeptidase [bacterium]
MKRKIKLKKTVIKKIKVLGIFCAILLAIFLFYRSQINSLKKLGYSETASRNILFQFKKKYILSIGENKTLNAAFESKDYEEKYLDQYSKIDYQNHDNLIKNINTLIKKGYSNDNISMILAHGSDKDVTEFAKRDKINYLEEFFSLPYAKLSNYDRYVDYSNETGENDETTVLAVNLDMDKENYENPTIVKKFSTDMLVNKHRSLQKNFEPDDLVSIDSEYAVDDTQLGSRIAVNAFIKMYKAAKKEGYDLVINSSYRSYEEQEEICDTYRELYGENYVLNYVAMPGFSEHQTGLSFDVGSKDSNVFAESEECEWIQENAHKYGFIQRFPSKYQAITGFRAEPWHYRYVGKKIATYIYEHDISFEEYYVLFLDGQE